MSGAKHPQRKRRKVPKPAPRPPRLDPSSGLPAVGARDVTPADVIARSRAKHTHKRS